MDQSHKIIIKSKETNLCQSWAHKKCCPGQGCWKAVDANPGLKVDWANMISCMKVLSLAYVLCSLRLLMLKTEG